MHGSIPLAIDMTADMQALNFAKVQGEVALLLFRQVLVAKYQNRMGTKHREDIVALSGLQGSSKVEAGDFKAADIGQWLRVARMWSG